MTDSTPTPPPAEPTGSSAYAQQPYVAGPKTNVLAIISLVTGILWLSIAAIITGHIALSQINKRGEGGKVLAIIGLVLGYLGSLGWIILWIVIGLGIAAGGGSFNNYGY
jgi:hypothetical protein